MRSVQLLPTAPLKATGRFRLNSQALGIPVCHNFLTLETAQTLYEDYSPSPGFSTIPNCTFQSGKQEREPEGTSQGLNSWRERELESAAIPLAERRRVRTPGSSAAREPSCARCCALRALGVWSPSSSLFPPPSSRRPPPPRPFASQ